MRYTPSLCVPVLIRHLAALRLVNVRGLVTERMHHQDQDKCSRNNKMEMKNIHFDPISVVVHVDGFNFTVMLEPGVNVEDAKTAVRERFRLEPGVGVIQEGDRIICGRPLLAGCYRFVGGKYVTDTISALGKNLMIYITLLQYSIFFNDWFAYTEEQDWNFI